MSAMGRWKTFQTRVAAKWVLSGEHSVLRGGTAIAMPNHQFCLSLSFEPTADALEIHPPESREILQELLQSIADEWNDSDRSFEMPRGILKIESTIPLGAGLGSSGAISVAIARWFSDAGWIANSEGRGHGATDKDLFEFARNVEHRFHGRSSGMDVAAILVGEPISFVIDRGYEVLGIKTLPRFTFHDTGLRSRTSDCIFKVAQLREENPALAMQIDDQMSLASRKSMEGLMLFDGCHGRGTEANVALSLIAQGMELAQDCYYSWGLMPGDAKRLSERLISEGARATKLTGAGGGGFIVAIWSN